MILSLIAALTLFAEISPEEYAKMQRAAPEIVLVQIADVTIHRSLAKPAGCSWFDFEVHRNVRLQARVMRVVHTSTNLHPGSTITIDYLSVNRCSGFQGPRSIEVLHAGQQVYAYLTKANDVYEPAARGASFSATP